MVIGSISEQVVSRLMTLPEATMIKSYDVTGLDQYGGGWKIVCESPQLSLPHVGKYVRVLNMRRAQNPPQPLAAAELDTLITVCSASLNIEAAEPNGPSQKKIKNDFLWYNPKFAQARDSLARLNVMVNHIDRLPVEEIIEEV